MTDIELYSGDAREWLGFVETGTVGVIVTSPPSNLGKEYGGERPDQKTYQDYLTWTAEWIRACHDVLEEGGRLCLNLPLDINVQFHRDGSRGSRKLPVLLDIAAQLEGWEYNTTIIWNEGNVSRRTAWGSYCLATDPWINTAAEAILVLSKGSRKRPAKGRTSMIGPAEFKAWTLGVWDFPGENPRRVGHPAPFPEELVRRLLLLYAFREDTVLDPFCGSGTTLVVAKQLGVAHAIGFDLNPAFIDLSRRRVDGTAPWTGQAAA